MKESRTQLPIDSALRKYSPEAGDLISGDPEGCSNLSKIILKNGILITKSNGATFHGNRFSIHNNGSVHDQNSIHDRNSMQHSGSEKPANEAFKGNGHRDMTENGSNGRKDVSGDGTNGLTENGSNGRKDVSGDGTNGRRNVTGNGTGSRQDATNDGKNGRTENGRKDHHEVTGNGTNGSEISKTNGHNGTGNGSRESKDKTRTGPAMPDSPVYLNGNGRHPGLPGTGHPGTLQPGRELPESNGDDVPESGLKERNTRTNGHTGLHHPDVYPDVAKPYIPDGLLQPEELAVTTEIPETDEERFLSFFLPADRLAIQTVARCETGVVEAGVEGKAVAVNCTDRLNNARYFNKFLESINRKMAYDGVFTGFIETNEQRKRRVLGTFPKTLSRILYPFDFIVKRVLPKLKLTRGIYFKVTKGRNRAISLPEALGRFISCGFEVLAFQEIGKVTYLAARKREQPVYDINATYGLVVKLNRIGKDGKNISLIKLRTMHPYSEYLQDYVFQLNHLKEGGKFENDFRVTWWGRWLRRFWLDEQPMWINYFRGEVKLVGVRPLSPQYFKLYPEWMQEYRTRFKPGLIPPFYADMPVTLEEIVESERNYLKQYEKRPFITDFRYFFLSMFNILFRNARSS